MNKVYVIGIGPGREDYLLPIAKKAIARSDCLIGAKRMISLFKDMSKEKINLSCDFTKVISFIKENKDKKIISVLVSGDPGLYSFLGQIEKSLKKNEYLVIPGVSALQMSFAKIGEAWQDAKVISLHGRKVDNLAQEIEIHSKVFLFTDLEFPPEKIASYLLKKGLENRRAVVFENLSYPDEKIIDTNLKDLTKQKGFKLCVMIIKKEQNSTESA
jgi:cobalt-precorrin-7 (C5)-methyltransferase